MFYTKLLGKNASHLLREHFLRNIPWKENWWPEKRPYQCGSPVTMVYKDNFKNFFQMTIHFLACFVTILQKLHFTRNYIFTLNISAEQLLFLQSGYFIGTPTFSEHLLLLSSYFFKIVTYLDRNIYRPATSCD